MPQWRPGDYTDSSGRGVYQLAAARIQILQAMTGETEHSVEGDECPLATFDGLPAESNGGPFFQRTDWLSFGITTALALAVYWVTVAPEVTLQFSGEFSVSAMYPGEPFPPGYPLWTGYAWLFTCLLPCSNIAWRVALSSAVAGALTCGVIALMASRGARSLLEGTLGLARLAPKAEQALRAVCGCVAGLAFGLDGAFWSKAVVVDVWPLSMLLLAVVLCLLMRWLHAPERKGCFYAAALVYGLTLTNSQALAVAGPGLMFVVLLGGPALGRDLFVAATLLFGTTLLAHGLGVLPDWLFAETQHTPMWRVGLIAEVALLPLCLGLGMATRGIFTEWKGVPASGTMLVLGLSMYCLLPFFSATNPPLNTGYARTLQGFVHTVSRGQFEPVRPDGQLDWIRGTTLDVWPGHPPRFWRDLCSTGAAPILVSAPDARPGAPLDAWFAGRLPLLVLVDGGAGESVFGPGVEFPCRTVLLRVAPGSGGVDGLRTGVARNDPDQAKEGIRLEATGSLG